jgi:hypothetical protein
MKNKFINSGMESNGKFPINLSTKDGENIQIAHGKTSES